MSCEGGVDVVEFCTFGWCECGQISEGLDAGEDVIVEASFTEGVQIACASFGVFTDKFTLRKC